MKAIYLDRDGVLIQTNVINGKPCAIGQISDLVFTSDVKEACCKLRTAGFLLIMVTNQPDIANGTANIKKVEEINANIQDVLSLDVVKMCVHGQKEGCLCRKPSPYMLIEAAKEFNVDLTESYMIGDRWSDIEAGKAAGCKTIHIQRNYGRDQDVYAPDFTAYCLSEAADWILRSSNER